MPDNENSNTSLSTPVADALKNWVMVGLSLIFVLLYAGALIAQMVHDNKQIPDAIKDLQPILFVIIGYYFGRLPGQQNENQIKNTLKEEIDRNATAADNANKTKENAIKEKAAIEGKMEAAKAVLLKINSGLASDGISTMKASDREAVETAMEILSS
jgi:hypothetical protein